MKFRPTQKVWLNTSKGGILAVVLEYAFHSPIDDEDYYRIKINYNSGNYVDNFPASRIKDAENA